MSRKYIVSLAYQSDKTFEECLEENLHGSNFAHNQKRSKAVSAKSAFISLLSGMWSENKKAAEADSSIEVYPTMYDLYIAFASGNLKLDPQRWQRFVMQVCQAIGYTDLPTEAESHLAFEKLCEAYESNNSYVSAEMRQYREEVVRLRNEGATDADIASLEIVDETTVEIDETTEETVETASAVSA